MDKLIWSTLNLGASSVLAAITIWIYANNNIWIMVGGIIIFSLGCVHMYSLMEYNKLLGDK